MSFILPGQEECLTSLSCRITLQQDEKLKTISRLTGKSIAAIIRSAIDALPEIEPLLPPNSIGFEKKSNEFLKP